MSIWSIPEFSNLNFESCISGLIGTLFYLPVYRGQWRSYLGFQDPSCNIVRYHIESLYKCLTKCSDLYTCNYK